MKLLTTLQVKFKAAAAVFSFLCIAIVIGAMSSTGAQAAPFPVLRQFCPNGAGAGQCLLTRGVGVDPASGHIIVSDQINNRIDEFTAWGQFVKAFGWGVVLSGPNNQPRNEREQVVVGATGGSFQLRYGPHVGNSSKVATTTSIAFDASAAQVQSALEALSIFEPGDIVVSGPAGGPWTIDFSGAFTDTDFIGGRLGNLFSSELEGLGEGLTGGASTIAVTTLQQGANFEMCIVGEDVCRAGQPGTSAGQLRGPQGVAVDASGNIYVVDYENHRVQKFDAAGHFLLMFGSGVEKGPLHPGNLCTAQNVAEGDTCGAGIFCNVAKGDTCEAESEGPDGQFEWQLSPNQIGSFIAVAPGAPETVYVGDTNRIQKFDTGGNFVGKISGAALAGQTVHSLAVDPSGDPYVALVGKENVLRLSPTGALLDTLELPYPRAVAIAPDGNVYVVEAKHKDNNAATPDSDAEIIVFDSNGDKLLSFADEEFDESTGLATSSACGIEGTDVHLANLNQSNNFVRSYGAPPDPDICPPPSVPPSIEAQFATAAGSTDAAVKAQINPHFWPDTRYYVQYGTGKCSEGGCDKEQPASPGSLLTNEVFDAAAPTADVFIGGLSPNTTYHYRFVAASGGGGPAYGVDPDGEGPEEASPEKGLEGTFHTLPLAVSPATICANQAFRSGASARLPDCRAYELVSPLDKNNGDIAAGADSFAQAAASGQRMTFSSLRSFGNPQGAPLFNQFLASRQEGVGWTTSSISPPRSTVSLYALGGTDSNYFKAFSSDLCSGWVLQDTDVVLTPGAPAGVPNVYRRDNCGGGDELITTTPPPGFDLVSYRSVYFPELQGFSADQSRSVFRADAALAVATGGPRPPFVCTSASEAETVSYQWLRNGTPIAAATSATYTPAGGDQGAAIQCQVTATSAGKGSSLMTSEALFVAPTSPIDPPDPGIRTEDRTQLPGVPAIGGSPEVGQTLTCTPGAWVGSPSFSYQWFRNATAIGGATSSTYTLVAADKGTAVQCRAIGANAGGTAVADSESTFVLASPPTTSADPTITGTVAVGETLTCNPGTWSGSPSFSYQWLRNGANIAAASASTYTLAAADEGKAIQCRVTAANGDATALAVAARVVVPPPPGTVPPALTAAGAVSGTAKVGGTLKCASGTWSGSPTFAFKWLRNGANILGANTSEYTLIAADSGKAIQCQVTATNAGGVVVGINSTPTGVRYVNPEPPASVEVVTFGNYQLYESAGGELRLVSVLPDGSASTANASAGTAWALSSASREDNVRNAVSADGSRVFWTATNFGGGFATRRNENGQGMGKLYLRVNSVEAQSAVSGGQCTETEKACTIAVSEFPKTRFIAANPQGTRAIYALGEHGEELYEADIEEAGGHLVANSHLVAGGVVGTMGASDDASRVYFVSSQVLPGIGPNPRGASALAGKPNIYLYRKGEGFVFVAILSDQEIRADEVFGGPQLSPIATLPKARTSRVSPDGDHVAFTSIASLTGYDNADVATGEPDGEVYLYDANANGGDGALICASCRPTGARPLGREVWTDGKGRLRAAGQIPGWTNQIQPTRLLSDDGKRVFFNSFDSLVPGDSNGKKDVYQWEAPGSGDCTETDPSFSAANGGCISLISSGQGGEDSEFLDATPTGSDVFFTSQSSLVPQDYGLRDVYDARVNGGFPPPASPPPPCEGEACQNASAAPNDPTPASSAFVGPGNVREGHGPKPCRKGKVRRKGRCVAKKHRRAHKHQRANSNGRAAR